MYGVPLLHLRHNIYSRVFATLFYLSTVNRFHHKNSSINFKQTVKTSNWRQRLQNSKLPLLFFFIQHLLAEIGREKSEKFVKLSGRLKNNAGNFH